MDLQGLYLSVHIFYLQISNREQIYLASDHCVSISLQNFQLLLVY